MGDPQFGAQSQSSDVDQAQLLLAPDGTPYEVASFFSNGDTPLAIDFVSATVDTEYGGRGCNLLLRQRTDAQYDWTVSLPVSSLPIEPDKLPTVDVGSQLEIAAINHTTEQVEIITTTITHET